MKPNKRFTWHMQLYDCYKKGYEAQQVGIASDQNPYKTGYRGHGSNGPGGNLQRQRQDAWSRGWDRASRGLPIDDSNG